jgi:hypothetical protein
VRDWRKSIAKGLSRNENRNRDAACNRALVAVCTDRNPKQNVDEYIANLRACARAHAPEAQAAGVRTQDEAIKYFSKVCIPVLGLFLTGSDADHRKSSADDLKDMGALPP